MGEISLVSGTMGSLDGKLPRAQKRTQAKKGARERVSKRGLLMCGYRSDERWRKEHGEFTKMCMCLFFVSHLVHVLPHGESPALVVFVCGADAGAATAHASRHGEPATLFLLSLRRCD